MIKNYIKTAWRSLLKNRFFSVLNIFGLAISLVVALLLIGYAREQLSYNMTFSKKEDIHRVVLNASAEYNYEKWAEIPNAVGPAMLSDIPEVKSIARLVRLDFTGFGSIQANRDNFLEKNIYLADSSFFQLFDLQFSEGNASTVFTNPKSTVISASNKQRMFGSNSALGKTIVINQRDTLTITGVFEDLPVKSSFGDIGIFLNIMDSWMGKDVYWSNASYQTFSLLQGDADPDQVAKKATALIDKYVPKDNQYFTKFDLQPLSKIYLYSSDIRDNLSAGGTIAKVNTMFILAALIIFIACINYMNLATSRSQNHAKEVGVNKVLGAQKYQIRLRFYMETAFLAMCAILLGLLLAVMLSPMFNRMIGADLVWTDLFSWENLSISVGIWVLITLIGGSYPAFYMSRISGLSLMKSSVEKNSFAKFFRQGLVVFQFTCSIILIVGVLVISLQMRHVEEKDLGYQPSDVVSVPIGSVNSTEKYTKIVQSIQQLAGTSSVATVQTFPGYGESGKNIRRPGSINEGLPIATSSSRGAVVPALGLQLVAGEDLPETLSAKDTVTYLLINEVVSSYLGYQNPEDAIGQMLPTEMGSSKIVGVIRNFNFESLKKPVGGYVYYRSNRPSESYRFILARFVGGDVGNYVKQIEAIFHTEQPDAAFDYQFLDEYIQQFYAAENQTGRVISIFSILTVVIACLGLFGLAAYTAEQRKKEIGVRKVLGASTSGITMMLSQNFLKLVCLAIVIASPLAWWAMRQWLEGFSYRIELQWWVFLVAGLIAITLAVLTVSFQAIKAAMANPVDSLRDE